MAKRDYYEVLGVGKNASADEIKSAYRKQALQWHPDRWVNGTEEEKKKAEENFKEAAEAYSVLGDADKKAKYDQFGFDGMNGQFGGQDFGNFSNFGDIFKDIFSGFGGGGINIEDILYGKQSKKQRVNKGRDIITRIPLTLEEIARGCEKERQLERLRPCSECGGKGAINSSDIKTCPTCNGTGRVQNVSMSFFGRTVSYAECPRCKGEGKIITNPCRRCNGTGLERKRETVRVKIPAGVEDGMEIRISGEGHSAAHNGINGDLIVAIEEVADKNLLREGQNLYYTHMISVMDAMLGTEISIPGIGNRLSLKIEPGTQSGTIIKMRGQGLPSPNGYRGVGDLFVKILVWVPRKLSRSEKDLLASMKDSPSFRPDPSRDDRNLFEKERNNFQL